MKYLISKIGPGVLAHQTNKLKESVQSSLSIQTIQGEVVIDAVVSGLIFELEVPLGFSRGPKFYEYDEIECAARKLIRAELNVIAVKHNSQIGVNALSRNSSILRERWPSRTKYRNRFINAVSFEDVMMVLVLWR
jgi:hypothetical protein